MSCEYNTEPFATLLHHYNVLGEQAFSYMYVVSHTSTCPNKMVHKNHSINICALNAPELL